MSVPTMPGVTPAVCAGDDDVYRAKAGADLARALPGGVGHARAVAAAATRSTDPLIRGALAGFCESPDTRDAVVATVVPGADGDPGRAAHLMSRPGGPKPTTDTARLIDALTAAAHLTGDPNGYVTATAAYLAWWAGERNTATALTADVLTRHRQHAPRLTHLTATILQVGMPPGWAQ